jgi:hypothetical protein
VYIYDPNNATPSLEYTTEQLQNIQRVCDKFGPANTQLLKIYTTDGSGNIVKEYTVNEFRVIT